MTMPSSGATARSDRPAAPTVASWARARSVISAVSSARARSRAVVTRPGCLARSVHAIESAALDTTPGGGHADGIESTAHDRREEIRDGTARGGGQGPGGHGDGA